MAAQQACGDESFAAPTLTTAHQEGLAALEGVIEVPEFADSYAIADVVMKSVSSSSTALSVFGATGSS